MQERGDIQKFYNKWWKSGRTCIREEKKDKNANALSVENVGGIFVVLVGGLILAVIVSVIEFIYYAKKNSSKINVSFFFLTLQNANLSHSRHLITVQDVNFKISYGSNRKLNFLRIYYIPYENLKRKLSNPLSFLENGV